MDEYKPINVTMPIEPAVFRGMLRIASAAGRGELPNNDPSQSAITITGMPGGNRTVRFTDIPFNRAMMAVRREFGADPGMFCSAMARMIALFDLMNDRCMDEFKKDDSRRPDETWIHYAVIDCAAIFPISRRRMRFAKVAFVRAARRLRKLQDAQEAIDAQQ